MRLKSTLWALAFACAAVSCSDDLDDGPNNNGNNNAGLEGPTTFMKISINQGTSTKAPTGGEEGDKDGGEVGKAEEYEVKDITVVLYANPDPKEGEEGQDADKELQAFGPNSKLVGAGYATVEKTNVGTDLWHSREATVTITLTDDQDAGFDGNTYGIIAVTNLGGEDALKNKIGKDLKQGYELANVIQTKTWGDNGFIMSTHNDLYGDKILFDQVTLKAGVTPDNAPTADVHVERLAAKIRISKYENADNFIYTIKEQNNMSEAKVRLDEVVIVNQLTSGTYLLKRVTENTGGENNKNLPALPASGYDDFLGNELWDQTAKAFNYVIDPWTRKKETVQPTATNLNDRDDLTTEYEYKDVVYKLAYDNDFYAPEVKGAGVTEEEEKEGYYSELWSGFSEEQIIALATNSAFTEDKNNTSLDLCYTQENTTSADMSKNGYSTGALFKATYFPKQYMTVQDVGDATGNITKKVVFTDVKYTNDGGYSSIDEKTSPADMGLKFYVYNGKIYDSYATIFNEFAWTQQKELDGKEGAKIYSYEDFAGDNAAKINAAEFFKHPLSDFSDPFGYIDHLKDQFYKSGASIENPETLAGHTIDNYILYHQAEINKTIKVYDNFVCYYPYWIRHANNDKFPNMGIMEFGIVRNNIYDMTVEGFNGLGLSGVDKPNPGNPDEEDKHYFNVNIKVKNWVVRKNSGIIL
ncbi:Mfa1 family fimbria major subunit [Parabacteroides sp.]